MKKQTTRERVLDAFAEQLLESGYRGISLNSVSAEAGIQRPSLYHHFPEGKEQIYREVALRMIDADAVAVQSAVGAPGGLAEKLRLLAMIHTEDSRKVALDQRIFDTTRYVSDETRTLVSTRYLESLLEPALAIMADAVAAGELRDLEPGFLLLVFLGMAKMGQGVPGDMASPSEHRGEAQAAAYFLAVQVVDLFLNGAGNSGD